MRTRSLFFRPEAEDDLDSLYIYVRGQSGSPERAFGYIARIRSFCEALCDFPERGARRDDLCPGLRIIGFERRAAIAFMFDADAVRIVRIFYGGREYEALLSREE